ncbi:MAG: M23 family metallopeptidase [Nitrospinaceae bacterium]|jgi:murein DD-endopeptidase MepM/ murein hydrolase activator NlpD|nr:M23 family metallopeptidase [Nitrospinaceae bacterium]MBT3434379.1 M23 family metallopeptidase [Nitrospinaceae bacterium]MBT4093664.1 M23 family metallopeptidase [Nitrospinaceae bacterium]MBT5947524.1 M23 family metallopeptidase [Nitrospinaceae bacterium]MBT6395652.1 M23 family metallopeptidase [Nitrospinaceae bacterium]
MKRLSLIVLLIAALGFAAPWSADAQMGRRGRGGGMKGGFGGGMKKRGGPGGLGGERPSPEIIGAFSPMNADLDHMRARGFVATGLQAVYPEGLECQVMDSAFGVDTRGDGSFRSDKFYNGYHGGMDIPAPEGTPILAVADGQVIRKKEGIGIGGVGVILQHSPDDTGLGVWTYTEYKHLREMPDIEIGQRVKMGEIIARAGTTGTTGGYYGAFGHSHLHLTAFFSPVSEYKSKRIFVPVKGEWLDPLALYKGGPLKSSELKALPAAQKSVKFAYKTATGKIVPEGAKVVWPFACKPK